MPKFEQFAAILNLADGWYPIPSGHRLTIFEDVESRCYTNLAHLVWKSNTETEDLLTSATQFGRLEEYTS